MLLVLLASQALAQNYAFCFYKSSSDNCPSEAEGIKLSSFGDWNSREITDGEHFDFYVMDDMVDSRGNRLVFAFDHLRHKDGTLISVSISATGDQRQCTIDQQADVYTKIVGTLRLDNLEMYTTTKSPSFNFTNLVLRGVTFVDTAEYSVTVLNELDSCPSCLASFAGFSAKSLVVRASGSWGAANPRRKFDPAVLENVTIVNDGTHLLVQLIGDRLRVADADAPEDSSLTLDLKDIDQKANVNLIVSGDGGRATVSCLAFGVSARLPQIHVSMMNQSELTVEKSNFPPLTYSLLKVCVVDNGSAKVTLPSGPVPLEVDATNTNGNVTLVCAAETSHLAGPVWVAGNCLRIEGPSASETKNFDIQSMYLKSQNVNIRAPDSNLVVRVGKLALAAGLDEASLVSHDGSTYTFGSLPDSDKFSLTVSKLIWNATELGFSLDSRGQINADEFVMSEDSTLRLVWKGSETVSDEDLEKHKGQDMKFLCGKGLNEHMNFRLPRAGPIGVTSTTSLFEDATITDNCLATKLKSDAKIDDRSDKFCIAETAEECPAGYKWVQDTKTWNAYVGSFLDLVTFHIKKWPEGEVFDFEKFNDFDLVIEGGDASIQAKDLNGKLKSLSARDAKIVLDTSAGPAVVNTQITLRNSAIDTPFSCANTTVLDIDEPSMKSINQNSEKCRNVKMQLKGWNDITKVEAKKDGFALTSADGTKYDVDFNDVTFTSESDNIEFAPQDPNQAMNGKFTFTMTKGGHTITMDSFPDDYYGLYGYAINGTLVNKGQKVLLDIIGNKDVHLKSDVTETVEIVHPWCVDTRLHLDEIGSKGKVALFDEAYFGVKSNITVGDQVTFAVRNGYFNDEGRIPVPVPKVQLINQMTVFPNGDYRVENFDVQEEGKAKLVVRYVMTQLPMVILNSSTGTPAKLKEIEFAYQDDLVLYDEGEFILNNRKYYEQLEYPIFCGTNIDCNALHLTLTSKSEHFSGDNSLVEFTCSEVDAESHYKCVSLKVAKKKTIFWYVVGFTYLGIALAIFVGDALYFIFAPRQPYDEEPSKNASGAPLLSQGQDTVDDA